MTNIKDDHKHKSSQPIVHLPNLPLDTSKYRVYLVEESGLSDKQVEELLQTLWQMMQTMVNIGWGLDMLNILLPEIFNHQALSKDTKDKGSNDD